MQRIINDPLQAVEDMLDGYFQANVDILKRSNRNKRVAVSNYMHKDKPRVAVVTGGGSGHKPAFIGYCGKNMVDSVAIGEIFSSPSAKVFYDAFTEADMGMGVACLYGNYAGDNMNVKMAIDMAGDDDIIVKTVVANDDVASASHDEREKRRGVAGEILMWKTAGALANQGGSLDEVIEIAQYTIDHTWSIGVGLSPCTLPANEKANFEISPGTIEFGIGHHGEPGIRISDLKDSSAIAQELIDYLIEDSGLIAGDTVFVLLSGLGATPELELFILYNDVTKVLASRGLKIFNSLVGNYFTSLDMQGATLTLMKVDDRTRPLLAMDVYTPGLKVSHHD